MADSQLSLELLFLQRRGGCSLTVLLFFLMLVGTSMIGTYLELLRSDLKVYRGANIDWKPETHIKYFR